MMVRRRTVVINASIITYSLSHGRHYLIAGRSLGHWPLNISTWLPYKEITKPYQLFGAQWIWSMDNGHVHHVHQVQHIHVLYVLCQLFGAWRRRRILPLSVGRDDATRFLQLAKPSFPSVSTSTTFFQIQFTTWPGRATSYRAIFFLVVL